ncbi:glycoside hydrolase [Dacryopinax primogenitus]|uniref:Glycoside hydrolase n=1 Tax=Dacryopinax primogenitus (strain DJM 731) TaxID=1858805 RepID=M5G1Q4_DACPD|nr:glycoside hydrolase [Dacryopinax primogenitus]EJU02145.1 glycoside hydrolase [Dacryopinax primogenitus]
MQEYFVIRGTPTKASNPESVGYDVYDLYDLGECEFDQQKSTRTHWGVKEELISLIADAQEKNLVCYVDSVLNHRDRTEEFGVLGVDQKDRRKGISGLYDIEGWTGFDFPGRHDQYSEMHFNFNHFTRVDYDQGYI